MFKRNIIEELIRWKEKDDRKPLILRGVRQVGKTTVIEQFADKFDTFLKLNLEISRDLELIESSDDVLKLVEQIHFHCKLRVKKGTCLLFIDEIQFSPKTTALLRYFYEDAPHIHVVAAGSLLENAIQSKQISFPVGRVEYRMLRPIHFTEFLNAIGEDFDLETLCSFKADFVHERMMQHFNKFITIGAMPGIVESYRKNRDLFSLNSLFESLIKSYQDDVEKYAETPMKATIIRHLIQTCWLYASEAITFENFASSNFRSKDVSEAFRSLEKAMLLELVYPITSTQLPYMADFRKKPKLFCLDTGLTNFMVKIQEEVLLSKEIEDVWRGKIAEQIVYHELFAYNYSILDKRHFWRRNKQGSDAEVDFVFPFKNKIIPIEVKSGVIGKLKSLHLFMDACPHDWAIRVWSKPFSIESATTGSGKEFKLINVPFYYVCLLTKLLEHMEEELE
jgi:uncharacterized protein